MFSTLVGSLGGRAFFFSLSDLCLSFSNKHTDSVLHRVVLCNECIVKLHIYGRSIDWREVAVGSKFKVDYLPHCGG